MSEELKPCPFCGEVPDLPSGDGTQYEIECGSCAMAMASVQICDLMTGEERSAEKFTDYRYSERYVERAKAEAIKQWNTRATPPAAQVQEECNCPGIGKQSAASHAPNCPARKAQVQGERPEVVGVRYQAHGAGWELMDESPFADGRQNWKQGGEELQALMTVAQHERILRQVLGDSDD